MLVFSLFSERVVVYVHSCSFGMSMEKMSSGFFDSAIFIPHRAINF